MIAHLCIHKGDFAAEASIGLAACQEDIECEDCGGLGCQNSVLCTDRKHSGAAVDHLNAALSVIPQEPSWLWAFTCRFQLA